MKETARSLILGNHVEEKIGSREKISSWRLSSPNYNKVEDYRQMECLAESRGQMCGDKVMNGVDERGVEGVMKDHE